MRLGVGTDSELCSTHYERTLVGRTACAKKSISANSPLLAAYRAVRAHRFHASLCRILRKLLIWNSRLGYVHQLINASMVAHAMLISNDRSRIARADLALSIIHSGFHFQQFLEHLAIARGL